MAKSQEQKEAELRAAGWTPSEGDSVDKAYARTALPQDQDNAPAPSAPSAPVVPQRAAGMSPSDLTSAITQAMTPFSQATSGVTAAQLAENKRQFDASLEWQKQMWANQGMPELQIKQQAQALAQQQFESQKAIAQANLALAQRAQAAQESQFGQTLGLDYLKTASSLGGPADYFQQSNFLRGAASNPAVPTFLSALQNNTGLPAFNAPSGAAPAVQSMASLAGSMTGAPVPIDQSAALNAIGRIGARGGQALGPQALEQLNPDEMALFGSGLKASGFSMPSFLQAYQQSRIGQGAGQAA